MYGTTRDTYSARIFRPVMLKYEKKNFFCELFYFFYCSFVNMIISSPEDGGYYIEDDPEFDDEIDQEYEKFLQEQGGS